MANFNGGPGNDSWHGTNAAETASGNLGIDHLYGGGGNDAINGNAGNDFLYGEAGNDLLYGGAGWRVARIHKIGTSEIQPKQCVSLQVIVRLSLDCLKS